MWRASALAARQWQTAHGIALAQLRLQFRESTMAPPASTILLVEDDHSLRSSLSQFLNDHGYQTIVADSARQGWELANARHPQLCLLDLNLPDGSGLDLLKKLTDAHLQTRVIIMTAFDLHHARPKNGLL